MSKLRALNMHQGLMAQHLGKKKVDLFFTSTTAAFVLLAIFCDVWHFGKMS